MSIWIMFAGVNDKEKHMKQMYFVAQHTDRDVCRKSSSGGAFTAIAASWFNAFGENAVVYGCVMDERMNVRHNRAVNIQQVAAMRGSKYVGSNTAEIFQQVESDVKNGKYVCVSGTPCQIAAVNAYLRNKGVETDQRLLTLEVICHGVGSTRFFEDYIAAQEHVFRSKATFCSFRGKMRPGKRQQMVLHFDNGKNYESPSARYDEFLSAYGRNYILRPSCFHCPYAKQVRQADIALGDAWGDVNSGSKVRTLVIVSSQWGKYWLDRSKGQLMCQEISVEEADQPQLNAPAERPADYEQFWHIYRENGYGKVQEFLGNRTNRRRIQKTAVEVIYRLHLEEFLRRIKQRLRN